MKDRIFFDTNIICYAYDATEPAKRRICEQLLEKVYKGETAGVVSNQVLGELFNAVITKLDVPLDKAKVIVRSIALSRMWEKINYDYNTVDKALMAFNDIKAPFWDFLIAETMKENNITEIITENEDDFANIPGIRVTNPLKDADSS